MLDHADEHNYHLRIEVDVVELSCLTMGRAVEKAVRVNILLLAFSLSNKIMDILVEAFPEL